MNNWLGALGIGGAEQAICSPDDAYKNQMRREQNRLTQGLSYSVYIPSQSDDCLKYFKREGLSEDEIVKTITPALFAALTKKQA